MMNRSVGVPEKEVQEEEQRNVENMMKGRVEELELFVEIGKHEKELSKLSVIRSSDELDFLPGSKPGTPSVPKSVASEIDDDDILNSEIDKNDYEWLLTPPGSPLSSSSEIGPLRTFANQNGSTEAHPATLKSMLVNSQLEPDSRSSFASSLGLNSFSVGALRPSSSGGPGSSTSSPRTPTDRNGIPLPRSPRPATPNAGASPHSSKHMAPTTRSPMPKARSSTSATRSSTTSARRSSAPRVRSSTPVSRSSSLSAKSSIPAARSSTPSSRSSTPAARSSSFSARSSTPVARSSTPIRSSKPGTRSSTPSTRSTPAARPSIHSSRSSTPVARSSIPSSRSSTPVARSSIPSSRSSTPVARSSIPSSRSSTPAARPIVPASRSTSRSATPTNQPSAPSTVSGSGGPPSRSSSISRSGSTTTRNSMPLHASSVANAKPLKQSEMPGLAVDAPKNIRTKISERPVSAFRSRPMAPNIHRSSEEAASNGRLRQQSHSPMRGQYPNGNTYSSGGSVPAVRRPQSDDSDNVNPVLMGTKMVERVMNLRKLPPPKKDEEGPINSAGKSSLSQDSLGFGRTLSKKSLDMAMRHMDIRRSMPSKLQSSMTNIPASSIYSVRSGPKRGRPVGASESFQGTSSNTSSEFSITITTNRLDGSELEDDYRGSGGKFSPARQDHGIDRGEFSPANVRGR